jgi:cholesterol transport system auxiliary component
MPRLPALALIASVALTGCSGLGVLGRAGAPQDVFEIRAPAALPVARNRPQAIDFIVEVPSASGALDTDSIMVRPSANQIQYLPGARWSENAPVMIQTAIVDALERTNAFRFVGRRPLSAAGDLALVGSLTDFQAEIVPEGAGATVRMTLTARLLREEDAAILASRRFTATATVPDTTDAAIVAGYVAVSQQVLSDLTRWVLGVRGIPTR